ncbi:MAG: hypothetical protein DRJ64_05365 [Thermoprotei archaeon]|nr:MAG: hypothetical protein DRJ64_05365 [Thermoprotei archaeon]HDD64055.1 VWA domain-containing protein [Thermoprotei archaeon]
MNIVFVLDTSESMNYGSPKKIDQALSTVFRIFKELSPENYATIIVFESIAEAILPPTPIKDVDLEKIRSEMITRGVTCLSAGIKKGLDMLNEGDTFVLLTDARPNLSLDRSGGFEGSIKLEYEAVNLLGERSIRFNFYAIAVGEDAFTYTLKKMAERVNGSFSLVEDFRGLNEKPKESIVKEEYENLTVSGIPAELPTAQPTWTKESQVLHVAIVSNDIYEEYKVSRKAILINPANGREARVALLPISSELLEDYRKRRSKIVKLVENNERILLDKTYRDFLNTEATGKKVKLLILK